MKSWIASVAAVGVLAGGTLARAAEKKVDEITCAEFLALNPDHQDRIAYWVDGYAASSGPESVRAVGFDKFGRPVDALVTACEATPAATLLQEVKKHL